MNPAVPGVCEPRFDLWIELVPLGLLVLVFAFLFGQALRQLRTPDCGTAISPYVAEEIARTTLRRTSGFAIAIATAAIAAIVQAHLLAAIFAGFTALFPLGSILGARRVIGELDNERARAELRGTLLIVRSKHGQARVYASRRVIANAQRAVVPTTIAR